MHKSSNKIYKYLLIGVGISVYAFCVYFNSKDRVVSKAIRKKLPICLGILAYEGVTTLEKTLATYESSRIMDLVSEVNILFQQVDTTDRRNWVQNIIRRYPWLKPIYEHNNTGFDGFMKLQKKCNRFKYVLLLEEDFQVLETIYNVQIQFRNALWMLENGAHAVRMRHRKNPGSPNYAYNTWRSNGGIIGKGISSTHLIAHVHWDDRAEEHISAIRVCRKSPKTWCASSANAHYTNNPTLYRSEFASNLYDEVPPCCKTFSKFEPWLTNFWTRQNFTVAYSDGIFSHNRLDRNREP